MLINRFRRKLLSHVYLARILIFLGVLVGGSLIWIILRHPAQNLANQVMSLTPVSLPQIGGRTNFLILGIGGEGHEGPDLTDTILFVSVKTSTGEPVIISIPRDLWVPSGQAKINTAYHYGYAKDGVAGGLQLAKSWVSEVTNQPVHFAAVIDFSTFTKAIDMIGGVDVNVERSFSDPEYPIAGKENDICDGDTDFKCRYETVSFTAGITHMDGTAALKYVRSRHSVDPLEGTDFARSRRQDRLISAVKAKLISPETLKHPQIYKDLFDLFSKSLISDVTPQYYSQLFSLGLKIRQHPLTTYTISAPDQLDNPPVSALYDDQWVLVPKGNDPQVVFNYVSSLLNPPGK